MSKKYSCRSGREKCFLLDIPFNRTFSFGCGTGGGNSTTDNVNVYQYLNIKRVARRT